jgi:hypothetical protein
MLLDVNSKNYKKINLNLLMLRTFEYLCAKLTYL